MVLPDATVTVPLTGTLAAVVLSLARFTVIPPVGAAVSRVTVPVEFTDPPVTLVGFNVTDEILRGVTVNVVFAEPFMELPAAPAPVAVIVSVVETATELVVAVNVCVVPPIGTRTDAGTLAADDVSDKFTVRCAVEAPAATGPFSVTVPVEVDPVTPPSTLVGFMVTEITDGGTTLNVPDCAAVAPTFAEINTLVDVSTAIGVTVNVVEDVFAGTVTVPGTVAAAGVPLVSITTVPPDGAVPFNVTVPVDV